MFGTDTQKQMHMPKKFECSFKNLSKKMEKKRNRFGLLQENSREVCAHSWLIFIYAGFTVMLMKTIKI